MCHFDDYDCSDCCLKMKRIHFLYLKILFMYPGYDNDIDDDDDDIDKKTKKSFDLVFYCDTVPRP
jgi:hypothetical protein